MATKQVRPVARPAAQAEEVRTATPEASTENSVIAAQLAGVEIPRPRPRPANLGAVPTSAEELAAAMLTRQGREIDPSTPRWKQLDAASASTLGLIAPDQRPKPGEPGYSTSINGRVWQWDAHAVDPKDPLTAGDLMGPDATQVLSRAFVEGADPEKDVVGDVKILNPDGTMSVQASNSHGMAELPESGLGFETHNRNDVKVGKTRQKDQWGTPESVARVMNTMADYGTLFPGAALSIGDMSTDTGQSPRLYSNRSSRHKSHYNGTQVDLRYPDGDASDNRATTTGESLFRQQALLNVAEDWGMDRAYASTSLRGKLFPAEGTDVHYDRGHNDHLHLGAGKGSQ